MSAHEQFVRTASSPKQVEAAGRKVADAEKLYAAAIHAIATSADGQRVLRRVMDWSGVLESGLGTTDAHTNYKAGKRDVGLQLVADLTTYAPAALSALLLPEDA